MSKVITIKGLSVSYDRKRVLSNIYMELESGSIYGVIGPNGAGKSTLFKSILSIIPRNSGDIQVFGQDVEKVRKRIAYIPQKDDVDWNFPAMVRDIVMMGRYPHKKILQRLNKEDHRIADEAMEKLDILDLADRQIGALSGGQQQRVFIARAICQGADLFFMDEPFVGVDMLTEHKIIEIMREMAAIGKTILVVHHDLSTADDYFDKVILLNQRLITYGETKEVFTKQNISLTYAPQMKILQDIGLIDEERS
ncbi:MAG: ABC-type Mn2+/Zn2+ transport system ATPase subunit [Saprospiraceae bacterium]|jgi:ABC-type Mn2+/Zn2+ transport system ATPase subunit